MYTIRKLKSEEIDKVMEIWKASTIKAHSFIEKEYWEKNYDVVKDVYIPMADTFVYDEEKEIRGFISIINNEFIGALFIDIDCQGLGIGSKLIDYVSDKYKKLELAVYKENESAVNFYKKKGFKIVKEQQNEDSGSDEYIMEKKCNEVDEYLNKLQGEEREWNESFIKYMRETYPELEEVISFKMPTYKLGSGKERNYIAFGFGKNHFSLHSMDFEYIAEMKNKLSKPGKGKGCVNVPFNKVCEKEILFKAIDDIIERKVTHIYGKSK